jgi:hypothetical protein
MIITKKQFERDILKLSRFLGQEKSYSIFIETHTPGLPKIVEMIVYELFVTQFDFRGCPDDLYYSYKNLLDYSIELKKNGFVEFK